MPELPEVETTIRDLRKRVLGCKIKDVWTDFEKMVKKPKDFEDFKKEVINRKIKNIRRRAKFILFDLSGDKTLLIHQKLTGHLLLGKWKKKDNKWLALSPSLSERINTYIHLLFILDNGKMLALSDLRKFAKIELWETKELAKSEGIKSLGPEPLEKDFTLEKFRETLKGKTGKIKQVLMDQKIIAGIGNIYSDEILFKARVNPFKSTSELTLVELGRIHKAIIKILGKAIELRGESMIDWRDLQGDRGLFDRHRKVYRRGGKKCPRCGTIILRKKIGGRSAHFCPQCQKL